MITAGLLKLSAALLYIAGLYSMTLRTQENWSLLFWFFAILKILNWYWPFSLHDEGFTGDSVTLQDWFTHTGLTDGNDVTQTPLLWKDEGHNATMDCSHTKGSTYRQMYWYRQKPGEGMKQIVFTTSYSPHEYQSGFSKEKFPAMKNDTETGSLTVQKLLPEDNGVYFCAVSEHSDTSDLGSCTNTQVLV